jgi:putative endonuclease
MYYVYLLESATDASRTYVGYTTDLKVRLKAHNAGQNVSTAPFRPWVLVAYVAFREEQRARAFERYLKSGSGKTFAKRHFRLRVCRAARVFLVPQKTARNFRAALKTFYEDRITSNE